MPVLSYNKAYALYNELKGERQDWETEWKQISNNLLPGRGSYTNVSKPSKRKLTNSNIINPSAEDALNVLTSGMHGGLTSPSRQWFSLGWADKNLEKVEPLKAWLTECTARLHAAFHESNFYSIINSFYTEYAGFGTGSIYMGEDVDPPTPFRFELLTAGDYYLAYGADGRLSHYCRIVYMSRYQMAEKFSDKVASYVKDVKDNADGIHVVDRSILECVYKNKFQDKAFTQVFYEVAVTASHTSANKDMTEPLLVAGFYEWPYPTARWNSIGSDAYGLGPGSRALPDIKRLQEMEKATLLAAHKTVNPPLNAPARMKGKLNTLPGAYNYYANPSEVITQIYAVKFDFTGTAMVTEKVEQRIQRMFYNDLFLTASRDPNASPLRTGQVQVQEQEKMLRLGPVIERLQFEFLQPIIERGFNILLRKNLLPELDPAYADMAGEYNIVLVSPLATAQRAVAIQGINSFLAFVSQVASVDQRVLDNVDVDVASREYANITGVALGILRPQEAVDRIRNDRAKLVAQAKAEQQDKENTANQATLTASNATTAKTQAEAGATMIESQVMAKESGII